MVVRKTFAGTNQASSVRASLEGRVINAAVGLATVPAGKRWKVTGMSGFVDALGADATYGVAIKRGANYRMCGNSVGAKQTSIFTGELMLQAGDIITNVGQNGSTNGTVDMTATYQEFNA